MLMRSFTRPKGSDTADQDACPGKPSFGQASHSTYGICPCDNVLMYLQHVPGTAKLGKEATAGAPEFVACFHAEIKCTAM